MYNNLHYNGSGYPDPTAEKGIKHAEKDNKKMKKIISTFAQVDFTKLKNPMIIISHNPSESNEYYMAKIWDSDKPTNTIMLKKKLSQIREDIKKNLPNMVRLPKAENDDPAIVETWI